MNKEEAISITSEHIAETIEVKKSLLTQTEEISDIASVLVSVFKNNGKVLVAGNGGSTCDSMHFSEELVARYLRERPGLPVQNLCDSSVITCWSNDYSFNDVFRRQVQAFGKENDALLVFTTSGSSKNILLALEEANKIGMQTIALLGKDGGEAKNLAKHSFIVKSYTTSRIQEAHAVIIHILCELIELTLFKKMF